MDYILSQVGHGMGVNYNDEKLIAAEFVKTQKCKPYNVNRFAVTFKSQQELVDFVKKYN